MLYALYRVSANMLPIALEGLPVSSSGHVLLVAAFLSHSFGMPSADTLAPALDHIVHLPIAILVACFFFSRWFYLLKNSVRLWKQFFKILFLGFITVAVTALIYFFLQYIGTSWFPLWLGFACNH